MRLWGVIYWEKFQRIAYSLTHSIIAANILLYWLYCFSPILKTFFEYHKYSSILILFKSSVSSSINILSFRSIQILWAIQYFYHYTYKLSHITLLQYIQYYYLEYHSTSLIRKNVKVSHMNAAKCNLNICEITVYFYIICKIRKIFVELSVEMNNKLETKILMCLSNLVLLLCKVFSLKSYC